MYFHAWILASVFKPEPQILALKYSGYLKTIYYRRYKNKVLDIENNT